MPRPIRVCTGPVGRVPEELHTKLTNDELEGFLTEARILRLLEHPLIVRVLDFAVEDGSPFLIMEYAPNGTLRQRHTQSAPIPLDTMVSYVKPENMLVGKHHEVLLSDFGFVTISQSSRAEKVQDIAGTMAYMAPEQILAQPSRASDQYALGIVTYEWLCGQRPFDGTLEEIAAKHMSLAPPSLCERIPTLSPLVERVVMRALEKEPSRRFASVQEFAEAFEQACVIGPEAAKWRESLRPNKPSKVQIVNPEITEPKALTPPVIPQLNAGFAGFMNRPGIGVAPDAMGFFGSGPVTSFNLELEGPASKSFSFQSYPVHALALSPDGKRVAFGGWDETVYVYDIAEGGKVFNYPGHTDRVHNLAWSPDGKSIASTSNDKTVQVWDAATATLIFTYREHLDPVVTVTWSPDKHHIASGSLDHTVHIWDVVTGRNILIYRGHTHFVWSVAWSPDGKRIASASEDRTVQIWDVNTGKNVFTYQGHSAPIETLAWSPDGKYIASNEGPMVQVWNAATGDPVTAYQAHLNNEVFELLHVSWSPDGTRIAASDQDGKIWVGSVDLPDVPT